MSIINEKELLEIIEEDCKKKQEVLNISGWGIRSLPAEIGKLAELHVLRLNNNELTSLPAEIGKLKKLRELYLYDNDLTSLPTEIGWLTELNKLDVSGNPLTSPPPAIVWRGLEAIKSYLRALAEGEQQEWVSKMILVGEGGVGKTSLLKRLLDEGFDLNEETTHGLQVRSLELDHPSKVDVRMRLNTWDFGGQDILHATHQFFLTNQSLFVLVWNARNGWQQGKLYYWLDVVKARAPQSPVLIVATHTENWPANLPYEDIRNKYPQVCGHLSVSNEKGVGIDEIEEAIRHEAAKLPLMGKRWPSSWLAVVQEIRDVRRDKKYIYPNELYDLMDKKKVKKKDRVVLSTWLHDLGDILYFRDSKDLADIVILDAEWVASNICQMLESTEIETGLGIFKKEHMEIVWPNIRPPIRDVFLRLMEQFDLSFRTLEDRDISIVVERLSLNPSESAGGYKELWNARSGQNEISMKFYLNASLPPGIPTWFIARSHRFTTYKHWRYGALFADGEELRHLALIRAYDHERYLELGVRGPTPQNFFALLCDGLELTLKRYPGMNIERKIPCPGHIGIRCKYEFDYRQLENAINKRKMLIQCPEAMENVSVAKMLFGLHVDTQDKVFEQMENLLVQIKGVNGHVVTRIDRMENELVRNQKVILNELLDCRELVERGFTSLFDAEQRLAESHCPNVFTIQPKEENRWLHNIFGQKMVLQLCCQVPGHWHPTLEGGRYDIKQPAKWFETVGPYIIQLAKIIKYTAPLVSPITGIMSESFAEDFKHQITMMEELAKKLRCEENIIEQAKESGGGTKAEQITGMGLRALRKLLDELDPYQNWGGLKKVLTPEGHYLWLCEEHAREYEE